MLLFLVCINFSILALGIGDAWGTIIIIIIIIIIINSREPYGRNLIRGAGGRSDQCSVKACLNLKIFDGYNYDSTSIRQAFDVT